MSGSDLCNRIKVHTFYNKLDAEIYEQLGGRLRSQFNAPLISSIWMQVYSQYRRPLQSQIEEEINECFRS